MQPFSFELLNFQHYQLLVDLLQLHDEFLLNCSFHVYEELNKIDSSNF